jgi:hypothetical protein
MSRWIDTRKELPPLDTWVQVIWGTRHGSRLGGPPAAMLRRAQVVDRLVWWHYVGDVPENRDGIAVRMWRHLHPEPAENQPTQEVEPMPQSLDGE